jgi:uncharacterized protein (TIGR03435 family)
MRQLILILACSLAQAQAPERQLTFDAATIKPVAAPGGRGVFMFSIVRGGPGTSDPGRVHYPSITIKNLLTIAYDVKDYQIAGPGFLYTELFEVQATMPPETTEKQFHIMLQNLLAERFKMTVHRETKDLPMYSLVVAKNGPKMKESPEISAEEETKDPAPPPLLSGLKMGPDGFPIPPLLSGGRAGMSMMRTPFGSRLTAQRRTTHDLAERLSLLLSKPVTDATELKANYDFTLTFSMEGLADRLPTLAPPPGGEGGRGPREMPDVEPPQNLFSAIQSQLGLKLEPKKGPVDLIVVDHAEKTPTEN